MSDAPRVRDIRFHHFDDEFAVEGYLSNPYGEGN